MEATDGKWIIEAGELAGMDRRDHRDLKDYLQRQEDEARMAYAREKRRVLRQFIVIGTTNDTRYLRDQTGNRRYWPVLIQRCDVTGLLTEREQLWAEAIAAEAADESIRLAEELWAEAGVEQEERRLMDPFEVILGSVLEDIRGMIQTEDVWKLCGFRTVDGGPSTDIDAPPGCQALPDPSKLDFFGEACTAAPYPANTVCHSDASGDHGWCIGPMAGGAGVCRPMAYVGNCPICPAGTLRFSAAGGTYCNPG